MKLRIIYATILHRLMFQNLSFKLELLQGFASLGHMLIRALLLAVFCLSMLHAERPPNVILIITDDQGYGDMSAHGHPSSRRPTWTSCTARACA